MRVTEDQYRLLTLCAVKGVGLPLLAREATRPGGLDRLYEGEVAENSRSATIARKILIKLEEEIDTARERVDKELEAAEADNVRLLTVLDEEYPFNLRQIHNRPPFLFILGDGFTPGDGPVFNDLPSVCVVGTRDPSDQGRQEARGMARGLAEAGVVVVSGLARGIDTEAHRSALEVGGRTLAVIGSGIAHTYPSESYELAEEVRSSCAVVSQFWPTDTPAQGTFVRRNEVMSGIALGTIVVEESSSSAAKKERQADYVLDQGKCLFMMSRLFTEQAWTQKYLELGAVEVSEVAQVIRELRDFSDVQETLDKRYQPKTLIWERSSVSLRALDDVSRVVATPDLINKSVTSKTCFLCPHFEKHKDLEEVERHKRHEHFKFPICSVCAEQVRSTQECESFLCTRSNRQIDTIEAFALYISGAPLAREIVALKDGNTRWTDIFGRIIVEYLDHNQPPPEYDAILANPGFTETDESPKHTESILRSAKNADKYNKWNFQPDGLYLLESIPRVHLRRSLGERVEVADTLQQVLCISDSLEVTGGNFLIYDDVCSSGAQLDAIARRLKAAGAARVTGLVLARTPRRGRSSRK